MKYKNIFFDLDHTLWDFDSSARIAFGEIFLNHKLKDKGIESVDSFQRAYTIHNDELWSLYREGKIKKEVLRGLRFRLTLSDFGIVDADLAERIGHEYISISPMRVALFPNTFYILDYLRQKYPLHIITNGFSEVQFVKMKSSGLDKYFDKMITSEEVGHKKPDKRVFDFAFEKTGAKPESSIMIGDNPEVDIKGAREVGMDQVLFDPKHQFSKNGSSYYINDLKEIEGFL